MSVGKRSLLASSIFCAVMSAGGAWAQSAPATGSSPPPEVIVTGSRIARVKVDAPQPIAVVTAQDIHDRGFANLADIINQLPAAGAGVTPVGGQNDFGVGRNYIDLFSLGSNRTLTLVDGLRFVGDNPTNIFANTGGNQVDINDLPTLFVDRIDTVPATGAAVYGSDAVSGVVNIVMKRKYTGAELTAQSGISTYGDASRYTVEGAVGRDFFGGRLNVAVDAQFDHTNPLTYANRPWTNRGLGFVSNPGAGPAQIVAPDIRFSGVTRGGLPITTGYNQIFATNPDGSLSGTPVQFGANGALTPFNPGNLYGDQFFGGNASGGDSLNLTPYSELVTPLDRKVVTAIGSFEITPHITAYANVNYAEITSVETINQPNYAAAAFGPSTLYNQPIPGLAYLISLDNAFLTPAAKATLMANGVTGGDEASGGGFLLSRANTDATPDPITSYVNTINASLRLVGDFKLFDRQFDWNMSYVHGISYSTFDQYNFNYGNAALNLPNRLGYALDSVIGPDGKPACRVKVQNPTSTDPAIAGCLPFNPFGVNNNSKAVLNYVTADFGNKATNEQDDFQANLSGDVIKLPAGALKASVGFETRKERATFSPSLASAEGIGYSVAIDGQVGSYYTDEFYGEVNIPVLGPGFNLPLAQRLEVSGAYRTVHNSIAGDNHAWSYGIEFSPIKDITFRGSQSNTFRGPSLQELFSASTPAYDSGADPCQVSNITAGPNPAARRKNCIAAFQSLLGPGTTEAQAATFLAGFTDSTVSDATIPITVGGNPQLKNEIGDSWTYGVVLQPRFVPGLTVSADFVEIDITNAIEALSIGNLMEGCYDAPTYPSEDCSRFQRNGQGQVTGAQEAFVNAGFTHFAAVTYTADYHTRLNDLPFVHTERDLGRFNFTISGVNTLRSVNSVSGKGFDNIDSAGVLALSSNTNTTTPTWRWEGQFTWNRGPLRVEWNTHYISGSKYDLTFTAANQFPLKVGDNWTHDLSLGYQITPWLNARLNVKNLFNQAPPYPVGTYQAGYYDFIGRYFLFGLDGKF